MNKYRKERYISQRVNSYGEYSFQVRVRSEDGDIVKTFNEKDFPSSKAAFESAVAFRDKTIYEIRNGTAMKRDNSTVEDMFNYYLENTTDSFKTKKKHSWLFNKYISTKNKRIQDLTKADIQTDLNKMVEIATNDTISKVLSIYRNDIVSNALLNDIIYKDLTLGVKKPESKVIHVKKSTLTDKNTLEKVKKLIIGSVQDHYNARIICFLLDVLYYTGMRPAEALALTKQDIGAGISVTKEMGSSIDDTNVVRRCKTPNSIRVIPIHPELKPILEELVDYAETDHLFYNSNEKCMESDWIGNIIRRLCKNNNIEFNMYRLRHNLATQLVTNNVDSKTTVEILGHANYDMSIYYANSNEDLKEEALKYLS